MVHSLKSKGLYVVVDFFQSAIRIPQSQIEEPAIDGLVLMTRFSILEKNVAFKQATGLLAPCCRETERQ